MTALQSFIVYDDRNTFEEYWSVVLYNILYVFSWLDGGGTCLAMSQNWCTIIFLFVINILGGYFETVEISCISLNMMPQILGLVNGSCLQLWLWFPMVTFYSHSFNIYWLEIFCKKELFLLPHLFINVFYHPELMYFYFILWIIN